MFIPENPFENVVWKMAAILPRPQYPLQNMQSITIEKFFVPTWKRLMYRHWRGLPEVGKSNVQKADFICFHVFAMREWKYHRVFFQTHDAVIKWKHFSRYWPFVRGIHRSPVNSPHKGQWRGALLFSMICRINGWVNNREAGDLRRYRAHYDVIVMSMQQCTGVTVAPFVFFSVRKNMIL